MAEVIFTKEIEFENGDKADVSFTAVIGKGGIGSYEFWGQRCYDSHDEIDEITFDEKGLTQAQIEHINGLIDCNELDSAVWDAAAL